MIKWQQIIITLCLSLALLGCATMQQKAKLTQSKRYFTAGYYKQALHLLLPLAADGNAQAQYAVGYMYYYGYGLSQDSETGRFWIERAAKQHYQPAIDALGIIEKNKTS